MNNFEKDEVVKICSHKKERIPIGIRTNKQKAKSFLNFILKNKIVVNNPDVYALSNWVGFSIKENEKSIDEFSVIKNIKYSGEKETVDLEILDGSSYVVNGIICHNTVNLPEDTTEELVEQLYVTAWKSGCKGITVYREGSRQGVLVSNKEKEIIFKETRAIKRPKTIPCSVIRFMNNRKGEKTERWIAFIGLVDNKPYEIFIGNEEEEEEGSGPFMLPRYVTNGNIIKVKQPNEKTRYDFSYTEKNNNYTQVVTGLSRCFDPEYWNYAKLISGILRHGMPLPCVINLVESLDLPSDNLNNLKSGINRALKKFIKDGTRAKKIKCEQCGAEESMIYQNGCAMCSLCGYSKC